MSVLLFGEVSPLREHQITELLSSCDSPLRHVGVTMTPRRASARSNTHIALFCWQLSTTYCNYRSVFFSLFSKTQDLWMSAAIFTLQLISQNKSGTKTRGDKTWKCTTSNRKLWQLHSKSLSWAWWWQGGQAAWTHLPVKIFHVY